MKVTEKITFDQYWTDSRFRLKRPCRNGSLVMMVGDNIYHRGSVDQRWIQEDSHHSMSDGSANEANLIKDTSSNNVLISRHFYYFGCTAPEIDLETLGYKNLRNYRNKSVEDDHVAEFLRKFELSHIRKRNCVSGVPFDFMNAYQRVDQITGKIS